MRYPVYKSLDNPPSFLGLKGSYLRIAGIGLFGAIIIGGTVGSFTNGLVGIIVFSAGAAADYLGVMAFQAKYSERERKKWVASLKIKDTIVFEPITFSEMARRRYLAAEKITKKKDT